MYKRDVLLRSFSAQASWPNHSGCTPWLISKKAKADHTWLNGHPYYGPTNLVYVGGTQSVKPAHDRLILLDIPNSFGSIQYEWVYDTMNVSFHCDSESDGWRLSLFIQPYTDLCYIIAIGSWFNWATSAGRLIESGNQASTPITTLDNALHAVPRTSNWYDVLTSCVVSSDVPWLVSALPTRSRMAASRRLSNIRVVKMEWRSRCILRGHQVSP